MTGHPLFDGTFSAEAVAAAAHALVQQLHDEAMDMIAALAERRDRPADDSPRVERDEPVTYRDPSTWSVEDDEDDRYVDDEYADGQREDGDVRVLWPADLPVPPPRTLPAGPYPGARCDRRFVTI